MEREKFSSGLGFLLISAGCAIGLGNVRRFPYVAGKYGGAAFLLVYLLINITAFRNKKRNAVFILFHNTFSKLSQRFLFNTRNI